MGPLIHIPEACGNWIWWPQRQGKDMQQGKEVYSMIFSTCHTCRQRFQLPVTVICPSHSSGNITAMSSSMDAAPRFLLGMMLISWFRLKATWISMVTPSGFNWFWNMCACNLFSLQKNNHSYQHAVVRNGKLASPRFVSEVRKPVLKHYSGPVKMNFKDHVLKCSIVSGLKFVGHFRIRQVVDIDLTNDDWSRWTCWKLMWRYLTIVSLWGVNRWHRSELVLVNTPGRTANVIWVCLGHTSIICISWCT